MQQLYLRIYEDGIEPAVEVPGLPASGASDSLNVQSSSALVAVSLRDLHRIPVKVDHPEGSPLPQSIRDAASGSKAATALALSFRLMAANHAIVA